MKHKKAKLILAVCVTILMPLVVAAVLFFYRPLIKSTEWDIRAMSSSGELVPANVYKMWFENKTYFANVDGNWFEVKIVSNNTLVAYAPYVTGKKPYLHADILALDYFSFAGFCYCDSPVSVHWGISNIGESAIFSNGFYSASIKPKDSVWFDELKQNDFLITHQYLTESDH